jgi:hypothetical protein
MSETPPVGELERTEIEATHAMFAAAPAAAASALGMASEQWDDAHFSMVHAVDHPVFNRLQLPNPPAPDDDRVARAVQRFRDAGLRRFLIQHLPGDETGERLARAQGLVPGRRNWIKLWRGPEFVTPPQTTLRIERAGSDDAERWLDVTLRAFAMPDAMRPWLAGLPHHEGFRTYFAFDGDEPVGAGVLYLASDSTAWLGMGGTLPQARGRGGQSAVLARRIADAIDAGARWMISETGAPVEGEPQTSFANMQRLGFQAAYERINWGEPQL